MGPKNSVSIFSPNAGTRLAISWIFKNNSYEVNAANACQPDEIQSALMEEFKKHISQKKSSGEQGLVVLNCRNIFEYEKVLRELTRKIMARRIQWAMDGLIFGREDLNHFFDSFIITHFIAGADLIYQIERDQKIHASHGDIYTQEFLDCVNLFCEVGISLSIYFEKNLEPSGDDIRQYNQALQAGKLEAAKLAARGNVTKEDLSEAINKHIQYCKLADKSARMTERFMGDLMTFLKDRDTWNRISQKRAGVIESVDVYNQYLELKVKAMKLKEKREFKEMEKVLKQSLELLEGSGDAGKRPLFDTYIELSKAQIYRKKYVSAQKHATSAKKIRTEAPSPHRLMGDCQLGLATQALKSGQYRDAENFFHGALKHLIKSQKLAEGVEMEEATENEIETAASISYFGDWMRWEAKKNPKAAELLKESVNFQSIVKMGENFTVKHKIAVEAKISHTASQAEADEKLEKARNFAMKAAELILQNKSDPARTMYASAIKFDEVTAFMTISHQAKKFSAQGEAAKALALYSWLAEVDQNEADMQYINVAKCHLHLGDKSQALKYINDALSLNKDVIQEAQELDPDFGRSEIMKLYLENCKK